MADAQLTLINLEGEGSYTFQFFPAKSLGTDRANWEPQNMTIGVKLLFYSNRDPRVTTFDELYLDGTDQNVSLTPDIIILRSLMEETANGTPPALLAVWGDRKERCVLEELEIEEIFYSRLGEPLRLKIRLSLLQLQPFG